MRSEKNDVRNPLTDCRELLSATVQGIPQSLFAGVYTERSERGSSAPFGMTANGGKILEKLTLYPCVIKFSFLIILLYL